MSFDQVFSMILGFIAMIPGVGGVLAIVAKYAIIASSVISGIFGASRALVLFLDSMAKIPGLAFFAGLSDKFKKGEEDGEGFMKKYVLPILDRLSIIPPAKK